MLKKEFDFFVEKQQELFKKYPNRVLIIKDESVIRDFSTYEEAYLWGSQNIELGTFIIQECKIGEDVFTQTYHSRISFA